LRFIAGEFSGRFTVVRWFKFIIGLLLLPACGALTVSVWEMARALALAQHASARMFGVAFAAGYALWLVVFALLPKPSRTYVLGHELTHALWALMMGARVGGLRVGKSGGQVRTSKTNWAITLAPYFFPFYAMLFIALFFIGHAIWDWSRYYPVLFFLAGLGWSFHVTFTLMILFTVRQPDVQSQGFVFSMVVIYCMNLLTIAVVAALLSQSMSVMTLLKLIGHHLWSAYGWALDKVVGVWHLVAPYAIGS
jgi:hypothetical protein